MWTKLPRPPSRSTSPWCHGVAQVPVYGAQKYAVRVQLDPNAHGLAQIGIDEVSQRCQRGNTNLPTGTLYGQNHTFTLLSNGQLQNAAQFGPVIVAYRNGAPVRLDELGRVIDSVQDDKTAAWYNSDRAIVLAIQRQPGTNTVEVVNAVNAAAAPPGSANSRPPCRSTPSTTAPIPSAPRSTT